MTQEINIHRSISHKYIVKFHSFFEDSDHVYILLELCRRRVSKQKLLAKKTSGFQIKPQMAQ